MYSSVSFHKLDSTVNLHQQTGPYSQKPFLPHSSYCLHPSPQSNRHPNFCLHRQRCSKGMYITCRSWGIQVTVRSVLDGDAAAQVSSGVLLLQPQTTVGAARSELETTLYYWVCLLETSDARQWKHQKPCPVRISGRRKGDHRPPPRNLRSRAIHPVTGQSAGFWVLEHAFSRPPSHRCMDELYIGSSWEGLKS